MGGIKWYREETTDSFALLNVIQDFCPGHLLPTIRSIYRYVLNPSLTVILVYLRRSTLGG